jgi:hypothetical protein
MFEKTCPESVEFYRTKRVEQVQQKIKTATNFRRQQKWLIVYNALVDPREAAEIA